MKKAKTMSDIDEILEKIKTEKYYKHPQYGHVYGTQVKAPQGRCAWLSLVNPKAPPPPKEGEKEGQPRFELTHLISKSTKEAKNFFKILEAMSDAMLLKYNEGKKAKLSELSLYLDGDSEEVDHEKYPYYKGCYVMIMRNAQRPQIVGPKRVDGKFPEIPAEEVKGGNIVVPVITPLITAHGISYKLNLVQFIKDDGVSFGGSAKPATDLLDDLSPEVDEEDSEVEADEPPVKQAVKSAKGKAAAVNLLA